MSGIEIALLIAGLIVFAASFIFSSASDKKESEKVLVILSNKQKDDIKNQILSVFDEQMAELKDKTEVELDKMSAQKMNEMNEYSETILGEINRNHNEVMFLYDMLNEKKKEINNTVRDLNIVKKELMAENAKAAYAAQSAKEQSEPAKEEPPKEKKKPAKSTSGKQTADKQASGKQSGNSEDKAKDKPKERIIDDGEPQTDREAQNPKPRRKTAKTAAERSRSTIKNESERDDNKSVELIAGGNNNEKILELSRQGKSNVEIAKALGLGIGEVKLVVDLYKGGR